MSELVLQGSVLAHANVNIALIKYWGKAPERGAWEQNLPAVPSLSLTLDGLGSETRVRFAPDATDDLLILDGKTLEGAALARSRPILDRVRDLADVAAPFHVESVNHVPTAAGLASSASGAAALAAGAARCAGLELSLEELSALARLGSGSASRSVFPGWATWEGPHAQGVAGVDHWDVSLVVALIDSGQKSISSREAMNRTARTSPLYSGWVASARAEFDAGFAAVRARDMGALCAAMERSTLRMHASAMGADPPVLYWKPASVAIIEVVRGLREGGVACGWTMDAGPNVKVLCARESAEQVREAIQRVAGVSKVLVCAPGAGVRVHVESDTP
jgi:diphosphomevalonate decarboxylase